MYDHCIDLTMTQPQLGIYNFYRHIRQSKILNYASYRQWCVIVYCRFLPCIIISHPIKDDNMCVDMLLIHVVLWRTLWINIDIGAYINISINQHGWCTLTCLLTGNYYDESSSFNYWRPCYEWMNCEWVIICDLLIKVHMKCTKCICELVALTAILYMSKKLKTDGHDTPHPLKSECILESLVFFWTTPDTWPYMYIWMWNDFGGKHWAQFGAPCSIPLRPDYHGWLTESASMNTQQSWQFRIR